MLQQGNTLQLQPMVDNIATDRMQDNPLSIPGILGRTLVDTSSSYKLIKDSEGNFSCEVSYDEYINAGKYNLQIYKYMCTRMYVLALIF